MSHWQRVSGDGMQTLLPFSPENNAALARPQQARPFEVEALAKHDPGGSLTTMHSKTTWGCALCRGSKRLTSWLLDIDQI